jgi:SAM-dependent methyltransferase
LHSDSPNVHLMQADLLTQPLPFEDDFFDSVSAYDFLEHIPRVIVDHEGRSLFPFIRLMNEIWRVMRHDGAFFALTPCYPAPEAFQDPTHVNIITDKTFPAYFCYALPWAHQYGFTGRFNFTKQDWEGPCLRTWMNKISKPTVPA